MTECFLGLGKCSSVYFFILGSIFFNTISYFSSFYILLNEFKVIKNMCKYFGFVFFGCIGLFIEKKIEQKIKSKKEEKKLIDEGGVKITFKNIIELIIICLINVIYYDSREIIDTLNVYDLEFWTFNIIFMLLFMRIYFPSNLYLHRNISMGLIIVVDSILLVITSLCKSFKNNDGQYLNIYEKINNCFEVAIYISFFIIMTFFISFAEVKGKVLMDTKFISPYSILILTGIFGLIINIGLSIFTFIKEETCSNKYLCHYCVQNYIKKFYILDKERYIEIIFTFIYFLFSFLSGTFDYYIMKYLYPNFILMSDTIYYEFVALHNFIRNNNKKEGEIMKKFILFQITESLEFICCAIYLEIIELRFCGLNKDIKRNIIERGEIETKDLLIDVNSAKNENENIINDEKKVNI